MKKYLELFRKPGFSSFLWTQFLGAFNDNAFKIVISMYAIKNQNALSGVYISLIGAIFMIPFFFFSGYAGYAADRINKRSILICTKGFELLAMIMAFFAFLNGGIEWMLWVLFLMALQTTFFSTAKYGILPEMLPDIDLSRANGLVEMSTFLAIILGTSSGGFLFSLWNQDLHLIGLVLIGFAAAGYGTSFGIAKVPHPQGKPQFRINPWSEIGKGIRRLTKNRMLWSTALGIAYFAFLGAFLQMGFLLFGNEVMQLDEFSISLLGTFLAVGVGLGSLLAGRLSGDKVELGLVPLGSIGMGIFSIALAFSGNSFLKTSFVLVLLGCAGGLFSVPLYAMLQQKSGKEERGQLIGTANFLLTVGILFASGCLWFLHDFFSFAPDQIILILGLFTLTMTPYVMKIVPQYLIRFSLWMLTHTMFQIRIQGQEHVPFRGPALLVCNHGSFVDGFLVGACLQRFIRFMVHRSLFDIRVIGWLLKKMNAIPIHEAQGETFRALKIGRTALEEGHVVCLFIEGASSKIGHMFTFREEFEWMVQDKNVPVIPVYLEGLSGSVYSTLKGPYKPFYPVSVRFGPPLPSSSTAKDIRQAVAQMGSGMEARPSALEPSLFSENDVN
ncbi:MAG: MFS transporter [Nitrospiria bacterium]